MTTKLHRIVSMAIASALSLGAVQTYAQTQGQSQGGKAAAAKPAKSLPATDDAKRRGKGDRIMTKDELRACMRLKESNDSGMAEIERRQAELDKERAELANAPDSSAGVRAAVDEKLAAVKQADAAYGEHGKAIQDWNERMAAFEAKAKDMRNADRRREVLRQEHIALKATETRLLAERNEKVALYEAAVKEANEKLSQSSGRNAEWNKRSEALAADEQALLDSRRKWSTECGDRRFREDDEAAIKAGK